MSGEGSIAAKYLSNPATRERRREDEAGSTQGIGERYVAMLDLVLEDGRRIGLPYAMLLRAEFDPDKGIALRFTSDDVTIAGYRLGELYRAILQHRAREVVECGRRAEFEKADGTGPVVNSITIRPAA